MLVEPVVGTEWRRQVSEFEQVWKKDKHGNEYCDEAAFWRNLSKFRSSFSLATVEYQKRMEAYDIKGAMKVIL